MTRGPILMVVLVAAGCSSDPPPIREAAPVVTEKTTLAGFAPPTKPAQSDPSAAKLVADALAAHTGNDLSKLAKLKSASLHRTGFLVSPGAAARSPVDWRIDLQAPGRCRAEATLNHAQVTETFTLVITPEAGIITPVAPAPGAPKPITDVTLRDCHAQRQEDELLLLHPLADPSTVAVPAPEATVNGKPASGVYVWTPAVAPALVHFDKGTGRLVRLVYLGREGGSDMQKDLTVLAHAEFGGVWLPSKFELKVDGRAFMDVEKQTYEVGKTFPPDHFKP